MLASPFVSFLYALVSWVPTLALGAASAYALKRCSHVQNEDTRLFARLAVWALVGAAWLVCVGWAYVLLPDLASAGDFRGRLLDAAGSSLMAWLIGLIVWGSRLDLKRSLSAEPRRKTVITSGPDERVY